MTREASDAESARMRDCAAIFDLDGTLIDSWQIARQAFCFAYQRATAREDAPVDAFSACLGLPFERILRQLDLPACMHADFLEYSKAHAHSIRVFAGVAPALKSLRAQGVRLGIVTGKDRGRAEYLLNLTGLNAYIDALITPDDAPGKPDPACLLECLKRLYCSASLAAYVGDSLTDMQCGKRAVVLTVFARWGALQEIDAGEYDVMAEDPEQFPGIYLNWARSERARKLAIPTAARC